MVSGLKLKLAPPTYADYRKVTLQGSTVRHYIGSRPSDIPER